MDDIDIAQMNNQRFLDGALERQRRGRERQRAVSREFCIDCEEPIPEARRKAVPGCQRCLECQKDFEG